MEYCSSRALGEKEIARAGGERMSTELLLMMIALRLLVIFIIYSAYIEKTLWDMWR